jgi:hypothetical protein
LIDKWELARCSLMWRIRDLITLEITFCRINWIFNNSVIILKIPQFQLWIFYLYYLNYKILSKIACSLNFLFLSQYVSFNIFNCQFPGQSLLKVQISLLFINLFANKTKEEQIINSLYSTVQTGPKYENKIKSWLQQPTSVTITIYTILISLNWAMTTEYNWNFW